MKKTLIVIALLALALSACGSGKADGIAVTVYRSPT